jgi:gas vesicle protein
MAGQWFGNASRCSNRGIILAQGDIELRIALVSELYLSQCTCKEWNMSDQLSDFSTYDIDRSSERSGVTLGLALLCLGLAAGAITALLMAPQSGKQLRRQLRRKYEDARDVMDDWSDQASDWVERGSDWAERASDWADKAKKRVQPVSKAFRR